MYICIVLDAAIEQAAAEKREAADKQAGRVAAENRETAWKQAEQAAAEKREAAEKLPKQAAAKKKQVAGHDAVSHNQAADVDADGADNEYASCCRR